MSKKRREIPVFDHPIIETHCHLDYLKDRALEETLEQAKGVNIEKVITIAVSPDNLARVRELSQVAPWVYGTQGIHPHDAENRGIQEGAWIRLASRSGETTLRATITDRVSPGVVYTTFHHPDTQANVVTTDYSDWATNCPEYKVTAVQVAPSNGPSEWQEDYNAQAAQSRRILPAAE